MSAKTKYTDEPLGEVQVISDFLPSPAELAFREEGVKVTLALSKKSVREIGEIGVRPRFPIQCRAPVSILPQPS